MRDLRKCAERIGAYPGLRLTVVPSFLEALLDAWPEDRCKVLPGLSSAAARPYRHLLLAL